jgi:predicted RNase H-like nuclease (RuvC/YqgF family)
MGWPSSHEHDQEKRDDSAFAEHEIADDLKALLTAPVAKWRKPKKAGPSRGEPAGKRSYIERLERTAQQQTTLIQGLKLRLSKLERALAAERAHVSQLKDRENKGSDLLLQAKLRQLNAEHGAEIDKLKAELAAKNQELLDLSQMQEHFGKNG